jgi:hypothetical protein
VEVDLEYPAWLHDVHKDLTLAPERVKLGFNDASEHEQKMAGDVPPAPCEKLAGHFRPHLNYVCDARLLQYYVSKGLPVTKLHRAMKYRQTQILKPWVEKNTALRAQAATAFEKDFFKLCVNNVFGKTMQNVREETCCEFFTSDASLRKRAADPRFDRCTFIGNLAGVSRVKDEVMLNKPIFMGAAILDLRKLHMFRLHYDVMCKRYGDSARLLLTDTDSLCYHIQTEDVYADMGAISEHFDTSDYPAAHPLHSDANQNVVGKFNDETDGVPITEFAGLRSKMYCFTVGSSTKHTAKGIMKGVAQRQLGMGEYKAALGGTACTVEQTMIQSRNHRICTVSATKSALNG